MNISSLQVIKRNPTHVFGVEVGEKVQLNVGDILRVHVGFNYRGKEQTATLYGAIGSRGLFGFDEKCVGKAAILLPESPDTFTPVEGSVDIEVRDISSGTDYDLYCKIEEFPDAGKPEVNDVIDVIEAWELVYEDIYHWSYIYEGDAETCTFEFKLTPEEIPLTDWISRLLVDAFVNQLMEKEQQRLLELRVYQDTSPLLWTNYRVQVTATTPPEAGVAGIASPIAWTPIIVAVIALLIVVGLYFVITAVDKIFFQRKALDEETKAKFDRETLVAMITDLDPDIPPEVLAEKTDQELRDQLNEKLVELAPPVGWLPLVVIGGLGVLGVGAAMALAMRRPE